MVGIDTNVLVRYIAQDDQSQSAPASEFIEKNCTSDTPGIINQIVLCELVWVLKSAYKFNKETIILVLKNLLSCSGFEIVDRDCAWTAYQEYIEGKADFSDYFIAQINKTHSAEYTATFDKNSSLKNPNFLLLK